MTELQTLLQQYIVYNYKSIDKKGSLVEAAVYKTSEEDIKFRVVKFVKDNIKEMSTFETVEEAVVVFEKHIR